MTSGLPSLEALTFLLTEVLTRMSSGCAYIPPLASPAFGHGELRFRAHSHLQEIATQFAGVCLVGLPPAAPRRRGRSPGWHRGLVCGLGWQVRVGVPAIPSTSLRAITPAQGARRCSRLLAAFGRWV